MKQSWLRCGTDERIINPGWEALFDLRLNSLGLTPRKREVMWHLVAGMSTDEIADALYITPKTVKGHISQVYDKLGIISDSEKPRRVHIIMFLLGLDIGALRHRLKLEEPERV